MQDPKQDPDPKPTEKQDPDPHTDPKKIIPDPQHDVWYYTALDRYGTPYQTIPDLKEVMCS